MASIAYITDRDMIEYHRLNGNTSINFWKPSNEKKMSNFKNGDYLFFLAKGTEKGKKREKGIIGYGKLSQSYIHTFTQMWTKYGTRNGYPNKKDLYNAIIKVTKKKSMPEHLNCLLLQDVVFFQAPVYLSEIGLEISNKVESYFYIDKVDMMNTSKILEVAENIGIDVWSSLFTKNEVIDLKRDAQIQIIQNIYQKLKSNYYTPYDEIRLSKFSSILVEEQKNIKFIGYSKIEYIQFREDSIVIYIPCIVNTNDFMKKLQFLIGHYILYKGYLQESEYGDEIEIVILFNKRITDDIRSLLNRQHIQYKEKLISID